MVVVRILAAFDGAFWGVEGRERSTECERFGSADGVDGRGVSIGEGNRRELEEEYEFEVEVDVEEEEDDDDGEEWEERYLEEISFALGLLDEISLALSFSEGISGGRTGWWGSGRFLGFRWPGVEAAEDGTAATMDLDERDPEFSRGGHITGRRTGLHLLPPLD